MKWGLFSSTLILFLGLLSGCVNQPVEDLSVAFIFLNNCADVEQMSVQIELDKRPVHSVDIEHSEPVGVRSWAIMTHSGPHTIRVNEVQSNLAVNISAPLSIANDSVNVVLDCQDVVRLYVFLDDKVWVLPIEPEQRWEAVQAPNDR